MIRLTDFPQAAPWPRAATTAARADTGGTLDWFQGAAAGARIAGDPNPRSRGLSVEQHAGLVLAHLRGDRETT